MSLDASIKGLKGLKFVAAAVPALGDPVTGVLDIAIKILEAAKNVETNKKATRELAEKSAELATTIVNKLQEVKDSLSEQQLAELRRDLNDITKTLEKISASAERRMSENWLQRARHKSDDAQEIEKLQKELQNAFDTLLITSSIKIRAAVEATHDEVAATRVEVSTLLSDADQQTLRTLGPIYEARFDARNSPTGCLENTRTGVLKELMDWARQPTNNISIYWLTGLAGTGKSTIAKSFCKNLEDESFAFVCTFFASKNFNERRDPFRILYSFVCELAVAWPQFRQPLLKAIRASPEVKTRSMREQVQQLLVTSLQAAYDQSLTTPVRPVILIIDALDECEKVDGLEGGNLISELATTLGERAFPVKLFVTSRPEKPIERMFEALPNRVLKLHDIEDTEVRADIRQIYENSFAEMMSDPALRVKVLPWPAPSDVEELVIRTGHSFIYASTLLKYIGDVRVAKPQARLRAVLNQRSSSAATSQSSPYALIDGLYKEILLSAVSDTDPEIRPRLQKILKTIVSLKDPLNVAHIADLLQLGAQEVAADVQSLGSVLYTSKKYLTTGTVHQAVIIFHASFRDFLLDRGEKNEFSFSISQCNHDLAVRCLTMILNAWAPYHSLYSGDSDDNSHSKSSDQIPESPAALTNSCDSDSWDAHPDAFDYALRYWPVHLCSGSAPSDLVLDQARTLISRYLPLYLSFYDDGYGWELGFSFLPQVFMMVTDPNIVLWGSPHQTWLRGFIGESCDTSCLMNSPEHHDNLALKCLLELRKMRYDICNIRNPSIANLEVENPDLATRLDTNVSESLRYACLLWPVHLLLASGRSSRLSQALEEFLSQHILHWIELLSLLDAIPCAMALLEQNTRATIQVDILREIWDDARQLVETYHPVLQTHALHIYHSVLPDIPNRRLLQCSREHVSLALPQLLSDRPTSYRGTKVIDGHIACVESVAISIDGSLIASGSWDSTIRLWDSRTGVQLASPLQHDGRVDSVVFSPAGNLMAAASSDGHTIRLWDAHDFRKISAIKASWDGSSWGGPRSVAFSPDEKHIASGGAELQLWETHTGCEILTFMGHRNSISSVAFSPDGTYIVSGSDDFTVRVWDVRMGSEVMLLEGHQWCVRSVAFSPRGEQIASCSSEPDASIRLWDVCTGSQLAVIKPGKHMSPNCIAFSPDGSQIASSGPAGVQIWDACSHNELKVLRGHVRSICSIAFAPDGARIFSGSADSTIRAWDISTARAIRFSAYHNDAITSLTFSLDGAFIATASLDQSIRIWSRAGLQVGHVQSAAEILVDQTVAFSAEGEEVMLSTDAGQILADWRLSDILVAKAEADASTDARETGTEGSSLERPVNSSSDGGEAPKSMEPNVVVNAPQASISDVDIDFDFETGWIWGKDGLGNEIRLCWLPEVLRGHAFASDGTIFAVGALDGQMTILDFAETLQMFRDLGVLE